MLSILKHFLWHWPSEREGTARFPQKRWRASQRGASAACRGLDVRSVGTNGVGENVAVASPTKRTELDAARGWMMPGA
jgi:hypothetical protein